MKLLYRGSRDGTTSKIFHEKCDHQGPTITLYKNDKGYIFGGYTPLSWTSKSGYYSAPDSFLFTLTNIHGTAPTKFPNTLRKNESVYHNINYGPCFGNYDDINITSDFKNNDLYSRFPTAYEDTLGKGNSIFTGDFNNNTTNNNLKINEIEVFKLYN